MHEKTIIHRHQCHRTGVRSAYNILFDITENVCGRIQEKEEDAKEARMKCELRTERDREGDRENEIKRH